MKPSMVVGLQVIVKPTIWRFPPLASANAGTRIYHCFSVIGAHIITVLPDTEFFVIRHVRTSKEYAYHVPVGSFV